MYVLKCLYRENAHLKALGLKAVIMDSELNSDIEPTEKKLKTFAL